MTVYRQYGVDSGGWRPVRMSPEFHAAWVQVCAVLGFTPVVTQGGFMGDMAAAKSGPTHDGDALDLRTRNLTVAQREQVVMVMRAHGIAAWFRDWEDPHIHAVPGRWAHPSPSALRQWDACRSGRDGLIGNGPDPHPYPLATTPPEADMTPEQDKLLRETAAAVARLEKQFAREKARDERAKKRDQRILAAVKATGADVTTVLAAMDEEA